MIETVLPWHAEIDFGVSPFLEQRISDHFAAADEGDTLIIDLSDVVFIDSTALGVLIAARNRADEAAGHLVLQAVSANARRVLDVAGLAGLFTSREAPADLS